MSEIRAGACGTVVGADSDGCLVAVAFVDRDRRPIGVERIPEQWLKPASRG